MKIGRLIAGLVSRQKCLVREMIILVNMCNNAAIFATCRHIPLSNWSKKCRGWFYNTDFETFSAVDMSALVITVKKSTISHPDFDLRFPAAWKIGKRNMAASSMGHCSRQR